MFYLIKAITIIGVFGAVLALLPQLTLPEQVVNALARIFSLAYQWDHVIDIESMIWVFFLVLFTEGIIIGWKGTKYLLFLVK